MAQSWSIVEKSGLEERVLMQCGHCHRSTWPVQEEDSFFTLCFVLWVSTSSHHGKNPNREKGINKDKRTACSFTGFDLFGSDGDRRWRSLHEGVLLSCSHSARPYLEKKKKNYWISKEVEFILLDSLIYLEAIFATRRQSSFHITNQLLITFVDIFSFCICVKSFIAFKHHRFVTQPGVV